MVKNKKDNVYLAVAGFTIKVVFEGTEQEFLAERIKSGIDKVWGKGGFLDKSKKKVDFEIHFKGEVDGLPLIEKGSDHYYLTFERDFKAKKVGTFYSISLAHFNMLLRDIVSFLVEGSGLLIHASCVIDSEGGSFIFMAPTEGGKSTVSNLLSKSKKFTKEADDSLILRKVKGEWVFYSPPFIEKDRIPVSKKSKKIKLFFIEKGSRAAGTKINDKGEILKKFLPQVWTRNERLDQKEVKSAARFVEENEFFVLTSNKDAKEMENVIYEA